MQQERDHWITAYAHQTTQLLRDVPESGTATVSDGLATDFVAVPGRRYAIYVYAWLEASASPQIRTRAASARSMSTHPSLRRRGGYTALSTEGVRMPIVFRHLAVPIIKRAGNRFSEHRIDFPASQPVRTATVALRGFRLDFANPEGDRHFNVMQVLPNLVEVRPSYVVFNLSVQLADKNFDDEYEGVVGIELIADVGRSRLVAESGANLGQLLARLRRRGSADRGVRETEVTVETLPSG